MRAPYWILAVATMIVGALGPLTESLVEKMSEGYLHALGVEIEATKVGYTPLPVVSSLIALAAGIGLAYPFYIRFTRSTAKLATGFFGSLQTFLVNRWYINALYYRLFVTPVPKIALLINKWVERLVFDNVNYAVSKGTMIVSRAGIGFDTNVVDRAVNGVSEGGVSSSISIRKANTGSARTYLMGIVAGIFLIILIVALYVVLGLGWWSV
jgi:NADH-quinone oxidoreductase subunit L